jgi:hypothetical protein
MIEAILLYVAGGAVIFKLIQLKSLRVGGFEVEFGKPKIVVVENVKPQVRPSRAKKQIEK